jgi:hypothetical protein
MKNVEQGSSLTGRKPMKRMEKCGREMTVTDMAIQNLR